MDASTILNIARDQANVTSSEFSDASLLDYLNISYHDVENTITTKVDDKFFYDIWTTDLVSGQSRYIFEESSSTQLGFKKIIDVEVKKSSTNQYYDKIDIIPTEMLDQARDRLARQGGGVDAGFFDIKDGSFWLYPAPSEDVTNGLKISGISNLIDLLTTATETEIFPGHTQLRQRHYVIAMGIVPWILGKRGQINEKNNATSEFEREKMKMVDQIEPTFQTPVEAKLPSSLHWTR